MRMTPQRQFVLDALVDLEHATPEQICQYVQRSTPTVNITTIYRTLELLESLGVVRHTHLGHGAPNYSLHEHQHVHLVCHKCGRVEEVPRERLAELAGTLRDEYGFALDASHLALTGRCRQCTPAESS
ncbi:MAG TPA: transcriptional repressor [Actinophytocola sp.]|uniref:Fur family transcriptional regulator n=1 Tax=Actinophytocola sp. TaxID=1872138 RepID=UPI002DDCD8AB|nr:transcriptional repressor [Actinophytocola sp.]HEV2783607.1 transcriptional repressor [Actinophytocola sp.]